MMMKNPYVLLALPLLLIPCLGFVWKNPCPNDGVTLQRMNKHGQTRLVVEAKNIVSAVDHAFVYNIGSRRVTLVAGTPAANAFIREVIDGNCEGRLAVVVVPETGNPHLDVFRIVAP